MNITPLALFDIELALGTQARAEIDQTTVAEYAEALKEGTEFPHVVVFFDGENYILADGFHRFYAHKRAGRTEISADVRNGSLQDAKLFAYGANVAHGLKRTNADKKKAVEGMLADFPGWSDRAIAKHVGVHHSTVVEHRKKSSLSESDSEKTDSQATERTYTTKHGTKATMNTAGQKKAGAAKKDKAKRAKKAEQAKPEQTMTAPDGTVITAADAQGDPMEIAKEALEENALLHKHLQAISADDPKAEVLKWRRLYDHALAQQSDAMDAAKRAKDREAWALKQLRRCGKAVGEDDPTKIAATVEMFVRSHQRAEAA